MQTTLKKLFPLLVLCFGLLVTPSFGAEGIRLINGISVYADEKGQSLNRPEGVACRGDAFAVADSANGRLVTYTLIRGSVGGGKPLIFPEITFPIRLHYDSAGNLLALDSKTRQIARIAAEGNLVGFVSLEGIPGDHAAILRSFAVDKSDNLYLLDVFGERVIILGAKDDFKRAVPFPAGFGFISDLAINQVGTVYLLDSVNATVFAAEPGAASFTALTSKLNDYLNFPTAIGIDNQGTLYVVDRNGSGVVLLGPDGTFRGRQLTMGWKPGLLYYPSQLCVTASDEAVIADRDNSRVQVFNVAR